MFIQKYVIPSLITPQKYRKIMYIKQKTFDNIHFFTIGDTIGWYAARLSRL